MKVRMAVSLFVASCLVSCADAERPHLALHERALVADMHSDVVLRMVEGFDISRRDTTGHMDIPRLKEGGIDLQVFACWLPTDTPLDQCRFRVDRSIDSLESQVSRKSDKIAICRSAAEAERTIGKGKIAAVLSIENGVAIANSLDTLQHFYDRGVRAMTLTHSASNDWCISSADTAEAFHGLTDFGRAVVRRMNGLGMIVDISHASVSAVEEVLKVTRDPVIASHSCVHAICDHDRNLTDEQIKAIAANGGLIGINFYSGFLSAEWKARAKAALEARRPEIDSLKELYKDDDTKRRDAMRAIRQTINRELADVVVDVGTVVDHIDHVVGLVGPAHVGLGADFDGVTSLPAGLSDCSMVPNITRELVKRGYAEEDVMKILGGNFMRLFREVSDR